MWFDEYIYIYIYVQNNIIFANCFMNINEVGKAFGVLIESSLLPVKSDEIQVYATVYYEER